MRKTSLKIGVPGIVTLLIWALTVSPVIGSEKPADSLASFVAGNNAFASDLFRKLSPQKENLFYSPYSISTALAMTYAGARGNTEKEMAKVLHFPLAQSATHSGFSGLGSELAAIQEKREVAISIANSLWLQKDLPLSAEFLDLEKKYYAAEPVSVDFKKEPDPIRIRINQWAEKETQGKIKDLVPPKSIDVRTVMILCNAIYFKGNWASRFDTAPTKNADFHVAKNKIIQVPTMTQTHEFRTLHMDGFQALELPYRGEDVSMLIFLPDESTSLKRIEAESTPARMDQWIGDLMNALKRKITVRLPRFTATCEFEMSRTLGAMGMRDAFGKSADFSGMDRKRDLFISAVIHKAFIEVNESGSKAAAATAVAMAVGAKAPERSKVFQVDRPFIFLIRENRTGSLLFVGRIMDPGKN